MGSLELRMETWLEHIPFVNTAASSIQHLVHRFVRENLIHAQIQQNKHEKHLQAPFQPARSKTLNYISIYTEPTKNQ